MEKTFLMIKPDAVKAGQAVRVGDVVGVIPGGAAGLTLGYWARKRNMPFRIYEAGPRPGGNCLTLRHGEFLFDSGAHRFHDKDVRVTRDIMALMGGRMARVSAEAAAADAALADQAGGVQGLDKSGLSAKERESRIRALEISREDEALRRQEEAQYWHNQ